MKWYSKISRGELWASFCVALIFSVAFQVLGCFGQASAMTNYNWPEERKKDWNIVTLSRGKMKKVSMPKETARGGCYTQGGVITEKYYVVSSFCGDNSSKSRVYFVDRKTNTVKTYLEGKYGHMNAIHYKWGTNQLFVRGSDNVPNHCLQFGDKKSDFKEIKLSNCKTKRQTDYGVPTYDVNGKKLSSMKGNSKGHLTNQGEAVADGYGYTVGWDAATTQYGQIWTYKHNTNALFVFDTAKKKLLKTYYIPSPLLEVEDVSVDGNGDIWLLYNQGQGKIGVFYKVNRSNLNIPDIEKKSGNSGSSSSGSSNKGSGTSGSTTGGKTTSSGSSQSSSSGSSSDGSVKTVILKAETMEDVLKLVIEISSVVIPLVGVAGIGWMGIEYITAKGDEARTKKAKQRLIEIVIGLAIYAVLFAIAKFLGIG